MKVRNVVGSALVWGALATGCGPRAPAERPASRTAGVRVVVTIVIDQFSAWEAWERLPFLPDTGGFARLRREGTWHRDARYAHAVTDTAPGHASLYTGQPPSVHGIVGNEVVGDDGHTLSCMRDASARLVAPWGTIDAAGSSLARLRAPTLADRYRARAPRAPIVSVSLKDRGALFGGGHAPTATLWLDTTLQSFTTSTALGCPFPSLAGGSGGHDAVMKAASSTWNLLDAPWVASHAATPDDQRGEGDLLGLGRTFPHALDKTKDAVKALRATPLGDELVLGIALGALDTYAPKGSEVASTDSDAPMLLAISLSSHDYIGHVFGPDSWEQWDELRRLDGLLDRLFSALDARVGKDGWAVVLSGDHGATTMPEAADVARPWCAAGHAPDRFARACGPVERLLPEEIATSLKHATEAALGPGAWVKGIAEPYVYFGEAGLAATGEQRKKLFEVVGAELRKHPGVAEAIDVAEAIRDCKASPPNDSDESIRALLCRSYFEGASGSVYVLVKPGSFVDPSYAVGFGTSHGSPYLFDRSVPMFARGPGVSAGKVDDAPSSYRAFYETASHWLGLP